MHKFSHLRPTSIHEAISLMESHGERARYIAGGIRIYDLPITPEKS